MIDDEFEYFFNMPNIDIGFVSWDLVSWYHSTIAKGMSFTNFEGIDLTHPPIIEGLTDPKRKELEKFYKGESESRKSKKVEKIKRSLPPDALLPTLESMELSEKLFEAYLYKIEVESVLGNAVTSYLRWDVADGYAILYILRAGQYSEDPNNLFEIKLTEAREVVKGLIRRLEAKIKEIEDTSCE